MNTYVYEGKGLSEIAKKVRLADFADKRLQGKRFLKCYSSFLTHRLRVIYLLVNFSLN
jgi:hypothetical protein